MVRVGCRPSERIRSVFNIRKATVEAVRGFTSPHPTLVGGETFTCQDAHLQVFGWTARAVYPHLIRVGRVHASTPDKGVTVARRLDDCSTAELAILFLIVNLSQQLPNDLSGYSEALGEIRRRYLHKPNPKKGNASWRHTRGKWK